MPVISFTWEVEIRKIIVQGQPEQKVSETLSQKPSYVVVHACGPNYSGGRSRIVV
jgi:hypothetical protein